MKRYHDKSREIPVYGDFDVLVCGGGSAGFVAAIAAARQGAKTLLVERYGFLGGTATAAMMLEFGSMYDGKQVLLGGITHEFLHRLEATEGAPFSRKEGHSMVFDPESMIALCQKMVEESGAEILLHSWLADAIVEEGKVTGVIVENKSGRCAIFGKVIIDCSGDGDIAARAGALWEMGRPGDMKLQPVTIEILLGNVDSTKIDYHHHQLIPKIAEARESGKWTIPTEQLFSWGRVRKQGAPDEPRHSFFFINGTNAVDVDATDARSLTGAELQTRRQIEQMLEFLKGNAPGFENSYLDRVAAQIGVRETRRISGDYTLTREDVLAARHFHDGLVPACNSIDVHDVSGRAFKHEYLRESTHYQIPYRCFLPKGLEGMLVAGRCLSADHWALGSARVMIITMPMGEAAGIAAALAANEKISLRKVSVPVIQKMLRDAGTVLET
ncbi:MAG: hypothetical protein A2X49_05310 [Lentisphaerae bacterium GWF2_52_8]|nr:MAG: hypothetical protein A2X49_05310 [Lentisphaerae bacterium GWF2_52_8]